ncbi:MULTISPECIES: conjugal transfer protein TraH [unclassified Burkholderia]|uniref:conjugal transfer protein TraH n=1 Tax=unclassified Burkholderia TaxID=2613784 RepID=UPI00163B119F|nr:MULTISPECIES: conjugal transfer protein TraH [unclassified Burkholderia]
MKKRRSLRIRYLACWSSIALLTAAATPASAGVSSQMDVMWNTTAARVYSGNTSVGVYGGNFSMRAPINTFSIVAFDPPHFNAGCGGIDMYLGAFSFLNGQQFSQMIRMIIQNAAGYLVHLAIKAICDPCESIMGKLEKIMQELNSAQVNTCKVSKTLVATAVKASGLEDMMSFLGPAKGDIDQNALTVAGGNNDWLGTQQQVFSSGIDSVTKSQANSSTSYGNVVVNAIMTTGAMSTFSNTGIFGGRLGTIEMVLNVFGTSVIQTTPAPGQSDGGPNSSLPTPKYSPTLTFADLVAGYDGTPKLINTCVDWTDGDALTCQHLERRNDFRALGFPGTLRYVVQQLAGDQSYSTYLGADENADRLVTVVMPGSIISNMRTGQPLTAEQLAFLRSMPVGYQKLLLDAFRSGTPTAIYNQIAQLMAEDLAASLGEGLLTILNTAFVPGSMTNQANGKANAPMPSEVDAARIAFSKDLVQFEGEHQRDRLARISQIVSAIKIDAEFNGPMKGGSK